MQKPHLGRMLGRHDKREGWYCHITDGSQHLSRKLWIISWAVGQGGFQRNLFASLSAGDQWNYEHLKGNL